MEPDTVFVIDTYEKTYSVVGADMELDSDQNLVILNGDNETVAAFSNSYWRCVRKNQVITE